MGETPVPVCADGVYPPAVHVDDDVYRSGLAGDGFELAGHSFGVGGFGDQKQGFGDVLGPDAALDVEDDLAFDAEDVFDGDRSSRLGLRTSHPVRLGCGACEI